MVWVTSTLSTRPHTVQRRAAREGIRPAARPSLGPATLPRGVGDTSPGAAASTPSPERSPSVRSHGARTPSTTDETGTRCATAVAPTSDRDEYHGSRPRRGSDSRSGSPKCDHIIKRIDRLGPHQRRYTPRRALHADRIYPEEFPTLLGLAVDDLLQITRSDCAGVRSLLEHPPGRDGQVGRDLDHFVCVHRARLRDRPRPVNA